MKEMDSFDAAMLIGGGTECYIHSSHLLTNLQVKFKIAAQKEIGWIDVHIWKWSWERKEKRKRERERDEK